MSTNLVGAHVSIQGGFYKAVENGTEIGATAIQFFTKSNRQWYAKSITNNDVERYHEALKASAIQEVVVHAPYLINLCSHSQETQKKSIDGLIQEIERCAALSISYLILHPGSNPDPIQGSQLIAQNLEHVFKQTADLDVMVLLETMAGQGDTIGTLQELQAIYQNIKTKKRVGFCLDTCHIFAQGYLFSKEEEYKKLKTDLEKYLGIHKIKVIHVNDSKKECGSHVDRHEHIGKGKIGLDAFAHLMNDTDFKHAPKILETPKDREPQDDIENINTLLSLLKNEQKK